MKRLLLAVLFCAGLVALVAGCVAVPSEQSACCMGATEGIGSIRASGPFTGTTGTFTSTLAVTGRVTAGGLTASDTITGTSGVFTDTLAVTGRTTTGGLTSSGTITGTNAVLTGTLGVTGRTTTGGLTSSATITGTAAVFTDTLAVSGNTTLSALLLPSSTTITATEGLTLTAAYTSYMLDSAGAVTITLNACTTAGQPLLLYGKDANTITIADSDTLTSDGAAATVGQYDLIMWLCDGADWIQVAKSANQ